jgi:hypothetical protein
MAPEVSPLVLFFPASGESVVVDVDLVKGFDEVLAMELVVVAEDWDVVPMG